MNAVANQRKAREALTPDQLRESTVLVGLRSDRAKLDAERQRAEAAEGPVVYMAAIFGLPVELTVRWLILLMVLICDPTAITPTVAASRRQAITSKATGTEKAGLATLRRKIRVLRIELPRVAAENVYRKDKDPAGDTDGVSRKVICNI